MYTKVRLTMEDKYRYDKVKSTVIYTEIDLELLRLCDGKKVTVHDYYGEDENATITIDTKSMELEELTPNEASVLLNHVGKVIEGVDILNYLEPWSMFPKVYNDLLGNRVFDIFTNEHLDMLDRSIGGGLQKVNQNTGRFDGDTYIYWIQDRIPLKTVSQWDKRISEVGDVTSLPKEELHVMDSIMRNLVESNGFSGRS